MLLVLLLLLLQQLFASVQSLRLFIQNIVSLIKRNNKMFLTWVLGGVILLFIGDMDVAKGFLLYLLLEIIIGIFGPSYHND